ncbi:hypothetical protein JCM16303_004792 [Sporobolomyces ruberrimus]
MFKDHLNERTPLLQPTRVPPLLPFPRDATRSTSPRSSTSSLHSTRDNSTDLPRDVDLSLSQLFQILASLKVGHLPTSNQFLQISRYILDSSFLNPDPTGTIWERKYGQGRLGVGQLSESGDKVRNAMREWVQSARDLVKERNPTIGGKGKGKEKERGMGDGWQEFIWRCRINQVKIDLPGSTSEASEPNPKSAFGPSPVSSSILSLVSLFFTSPEIRQLVIDLVVLLRDVAQVTLATEVNEERVPEDVGEGLERVVDFVASKGVGKIALDKEMKVENDKKVNGGAVLERHEEGEAVPDPPLVDDAKVVEEGDPPLVDLESTSAAYSTVSTPEKIDESEPVLPDQTPTEIRDAFIDRFKEILTRLQSTPQYQSAMTTLLEVIRSYVKDSLSSLEPKIALETTDPTPAASSSTRSSPLDLLIPLLEPFTGGPSSLSSLSTSLTSTLSHFDPSNPESTPHSLVALATRFDSFLSQTLLSGQTYLSSNQAHRELDGLYVSFSTLGQDHPSFHRDLQKFLQELVRVFERFAKDEYLARFVVASGKVVGELEGWVAIAGGKTVRAASGQGLGAFWGEILEWIAPRILGIVKEIPLPRIEFDSPGVVSGALELPSLLSTSFVPASITIRNATSLTYLPTLGTTNQDIPIYGTNLSPRPRELEQTSWYERSSYASSTSLDLEGMEFEILDVGYFVKYKTGIPCFPTITESGLLDLHFGKTRSTSSTSGGEGERTRNGFGFSLDTTSLESQVEQNHSLFRMLPTSQISLEQFDIKLHESRHPWFMWFLRPVLRTAVRKAIEVEVRKVLIEQGDRLGEWAYRVRENKRKVQGEEGRGEREEGATGKVWNWVKAVWRTVTDESGEKVGDERGDERDQVKQTETAVHLNRHGLAVELPHDVDSEELEGATVGIGTEGVVIPEGEATIPLPPGQERIGVVKKAKQEVDEAVESGRKAARTTLDVFGELGEASEEWRDDLVDEREKYERDGWRSDAFELRRK